MTQLICRCKFGKRKPHPPPKRIIERAGTNQVVIAAATSQLRDSETRLATMEKQVARATGK